MTNILVTGGAGYIGSHTCQRLAAQGYTPITYDNLSRGHQHAVKWGPFEYGDIRDSARLHSVCQHYQPSAVIHFAAFAYIGESVQKPLDYYHNNVTGTLTLLDCLKQHDIEHLVFSSTCATYGTPTQLPITEQDPQCPINPYGHSKLMIEQILRDCARSYGLKSSVLRYFNAAGADPAGHIGEDHNPEPHLIPLALQTAAGKHSMLTIYGNDYPTADGTCVRDYIHVHDLADAHILALQNPPTHASVNAYNLGNGDGFSVKDILQAVERITGTPIRTRIGQRRTGDPASLIADASLARTALGWQPQYTDLTDIIQTAWQWTKHQ